MNKKLIKQFFTVYAFAIGASIVPTIVVPPILEGVSNSCEALYYKADLPRQYRDLRCPLGDQFASGVAYWTETVFPGRISNYY